MSNVFVCLIDRTIVNSMSMQSVKVIYSLLLVLAEFVRENIILA